jgi:hypothetical protein
MAFALCPLDCLSPRFEARERMVGMIFDNVVGDRAYFRAAFRTSFNVNVGHDFDP